MTQRPVRLRYPAEFTINPELLQQHLIDYDGAYPEMLPDLPMPVEEIPSPKWEYQVALEKIATPQHEESIRDIHSEEFCQRLQQEFDKNRVEYPPETIACKDEDLHYAAFFMIQTGQTFEQYRNAIKHRQEEQRPRDES